MSITAQRSMSISHRRFTRPADISRPWRPTRSVPMPKQSRTGSSVRTDRLIAKFALSKSDNDRLPASGLSLTSADRSPMAVDDSRRGADDLLRRGDNCLRGVKDGLLGAKGCFPGVEGWRRWLSPRSGGLSPWSR